MRHRGGSEQPVKGRRANRPKARKVSIAAPSVADLQKQVVNLTHELKEANERQTATSEVLQVINSSRGDLAPVFDAMLENAMRLCEASHCHIWRFDGKLLYAVAVRGDPWFTEWLQEHDPIAPAPGSGSDRIARGEDIVHVADWREEEAYSSYPVFRDFVDASGVRTSLYVALRRGGTLLGVINVYRQQVRPFTERQIELVKNFANQAVIAIENVRLLNEQREALERQTATTEVLQVINTSPGDLAPVFDAILEKAHSLCGVTRGSLQLYDGAKFRAVAVHGTSEALAERLRQGAVSVDPNSPAQRLLEGARFVQIPDLGAIDDPMLRAAFELGGTRTILFIPLRKDGMLLGGISAARLEVKPFSEKEIGLLESFAAQAVIAMENARLLGELRDRTEDLGESLQQQTATADVLKVISRSAFDLQKVFDALTESACRVCGAYDAGLLVREAEFLRVRSHHGPIPMNFDGARISRDWVNGRSVVDRKSVHVRDLQAEAGEFPVGCQMARRLGHRTILAVPLMREQEVVGSLVLRRTEVLPFTGKQISLAETFADQAVIAIENARLFDEVQAKTGDLTEALTYQTGSANILKVIASSPTDVEPVLTAIVESACVICEAEEAHVALRDGDELVFQVQHGSAPVVWKRQPINC